MRLRLLPDSVFGRFLVVLIVCCALAQFVAAALVIRRSASLMVRRENPMVHEAARRVSDILALLGSLRPQQRISILNELEGRPVEINLAGWMTGKTVMGMPPPPAFEFDLNGGPFAEFAKTIGPQRLTFEHGERSETNADIPGDVVQPAFDQWRLGSQLGERIKAQLDADVDIEVNVVKPEPDQRQPRSDSDDLPTAMMTDVTMLSVRRPGEPALTFRIVSGAPILMRSARTFGYNFVFGYRLAVQLLVLLAGLSVGAYVAARRITSPLSRLAAAADALGRSLSQPPLPETGPRELRQVAQGFNVMQDRLRRHIDSRTRVVAAMSHDLRTPLTRMRLRLETLDEHQHREELELNMIEMEDMLIATLDALSDLAVEEAHKEIDINELLARLQVEFADLGHRVSLNGAASSPYAARPQALKRCLTNLINNAVKYGEEAFVSVTDGAWLRIVVADRGPGIPHEQLERVFEPFYRLESSRSRETGGTGLGLSVARDCAQAHGGHLVLRNGLEVGLEAELSLPRGPDRSAG